MNSGSGASVFAAWTSGGGRRDGSKRPSWGEGSSARRSSPSSTSAATPLKTALHLPQRTVPECAASCELCTRNAVPHTGQRGTRLKVRFSPFVSAEGRPALFAGRALDMERLAVRLRHFFRLLFEEAGEGDMAPRRRMRDEHVGELNQGSGQDVRHHDLIVAGRQIARK